MMIRDSGLLFWATL